MQWMRLPSWPSTTIAAALLSTSMSGCASQGRAQPPDDADGATSSDAGGREAGSSDSGSGSDGSATGIDAPGGSNPDASSEAGTSPAPDGGRDGGNGGDGGAPAWTCPAGPFPTPIPFGATPVRVAGVPPSDGFNNTLNNFTTVEGPVWIGDALYVSEFPGNPNPPPSRILKVTTSGVVSVAIADSGSNGLAVDGTGTLYGAIHQDGSISRFDWSTGARTPVVSGYSMSGPSARFSSPNDLAIRSDGSIYFSDPNYQAPSPNPQMATRVYGFSPGTNTVFVVDATLTQPNGVTLSPDEGTLYVSSNNGIHKYSVMPGGATGAGSVFAQSPNMNLNVDGMTVDCAGNLYGAVIGTGNVIVLSPAGAPIGQLVVTNMANVTNVAFGGADHKTLYVTTQGSSGNQGLFQVTLSIPGMPY